MKSRTVLLVILAVVWWSSSSAAPSSSILGGRGGRAIAFQAPGVLPPGVEWSIGQWVAPAAPLQCLIVAANLAGDTRFQWDAATWTPISDEWDRWLAWCALPETEHPDCSRVKPSRVGPPPVLGSQVDCSSTLVPPTEIEPRDPPAAVEPHE